MHWLTHEGQPSIAFPSLALLSESLTLRNYEGSQHPLGSGQRPYPSHYRTAFASSRMNCRMSLQCALRLHFLSQLSRNSRQPVYHVSCAQLDEPVRSPPSTGGRLVRDWSALSPSARPLTFLWFQPIPDLRAFNFVWLVSR